jgi:hypothetical protein
MTTSEAFDAHPLPFNRYLGAPCSALHVIRFEIKDFHLKTLQGLLLAHATESIFGRHSVKVFDLD